MNHRVPWAQECIRSKNIHHEEHACMGRGGSVSGPKDVILAAHWLPGATVVLCAGAPLSWMPQLLWPPDSADPLPFSNQVTSFLPMASSSRAMTSRSMKARSQGSLTRCASLWIRTPCCCQVSHVPTHHGEAGVVPDSRVNGRISPLCANHPFPKQAHIMPSMQSHGLAWKLPQQTSECLTPARHC